jgi:glyoxylase-like metal-dependent hydrolase (beta-lactamase superfamily II)
MNIKQVGENLWQLTRLGSFNSFLVVEADGLTAVDTGMSGSAKGIIQAATQLNQPIRRIVLTHAHGDHAGSLDALYTAVPDADVWLNGRTVQFLNGQLSLLADEPQAKLRGGFVRCETQPTATFEEGDYIGSLQAIHTPGHTPDHFAFWDSRDGTLIAGDAFQTKAGTAVAGTTRWLFPFPAMATWHKPSALASAQKLLALQPARLAVGHGHTLENPTAVMRAAIQEAEKTHGQATYA